MGSHDQRRRNRRQVLPGVEAWEAEEFGRCARFEGSVVIQMEGSMAEAGAAVGIRFCGRSVSREARGRAWGCEKQAQGFGQVTAACGEGQ